MIVSDAANDDGAVSREAGIEDAAGVFVGGQEGVYLVYQ